MQGLSEFVAFCHDEFWDCKTETAGSSGVVFLGMNWEDPRRFAVWEFLMDVHEDVGIRYLEPMPDGIYVVFDECGAGWPSMVFKIRTSFVNREHRAAALRRDRRDQLEMLGIYASTHRPFDKNLMHPAIRRVQRGLGRAGFVTHRDGVWDRKTRWALWRFRRRHHLSTPPHITEADLNALEV